MSYNDSADEISVPYNSKTNSAMLDELESYYARVLDSNMMNLKSPETANIGFFNNSGKIFTDGPKVGRTLVYMTRPNLNFVSQRNITSCRAFSNLMSSKLGLTLARELMFSDLAGKINYGGYDDFNFIKTGAIINDILSLGDKENPTYSDIITGANDEYIAGTNISKETYKICKSNFIPLITNTCTETGNAKDIILEVDETEGDYSGNRLVYGAGIDDTMGPGELTLTFEDLYGSPVMNMMILWIYYIHYVTKGICVPRFKYIINRIIDYTCSIYVFMLDTDQRTIIRWIKYTGCFPKSIPFGQILHTKEPNLQSLSQIQIPFQYNFASPMDPVVLTEFNMLSEPALLKREYNGYTLKNLRLINTANNGRTGAAAFAGKNHNLTFKEGLDFMMAFTPSDDEIPDRLFKSSTKIQVADNVGNDISNMLRGGLTDEVADDDKNAFDASLINRYHGMMDFRRNWGHPYICEGNQLLFL